MPDENYTYDNVGNRQTASGVTGNWNYNSNNELLGFADVEYTYDANGNLTQKKVGTSAVNYVYNAENRLVKVEDDLTKVVMAEYGYDPFGRRLWKDVQGVRTYFFYAEEGLIAEYDASGNELKSYGYKPDSTWTTDPLWLKQNGHYYFYQNDHLGTPQKIVSQDGTVVWSASYEAFGKAHVETETVVNNLRFPGQYYDAETGLHYNFQRYYEPESGRYTQADPIGFDGGDVNWYAYVGNNPMNLIDPKGLKAYVQLLEVRDGSPFGLPDGTTLVFIILPMQYQGVGATPEVIERFNNVIEQTWSGVFGKYPVRTIVVMEDDIKKFLKRSLQDISLRPNIIDIPIGDSINSMVAANVVNQHKGTWPSEVCDDVIAHETGHLMGLGEGYIYTGNCVNKKDGNNVMGCISDDETSNIPFEKDIEDIINIIDPIPKWLTNGGWVGLSR